MNQYNQDVNINFQGEDNITGVIDKVNDRVGSLQLKILAANTGLGLFGKQLIANSDNLTKFTKVLTTTDATLNKVFAVTGVVKVFSILGTGIADATANLEGFNDGLKAMQASGFDTGIIDQFGQLQGAILGSREALDSFSLTALTAFNRFNKAKSEVATLFAEDDPFIKNLSSSIQKLVNEDLKNAVTSIDALRASYEAASSGFTEAADNQAVMVAGLKLAKAGGADTGATMKVLAQTISAYGLAASDANKVSAILNQTVQLGVTTIPELSNGFAQSAVTANAAKIKLQELGAAVAALTLQGFDTSSALTGIESLSRVIISKTPQATAALRELRDEAGKPIKFDIAEIKADGLAKSLDRLNKAAKGNVTVLREIIPEATAYNTALALMANNSETLDKFNKKMFDVSSSGEVARKALDSVFGIKLNNQIESFDAIVNRITEQFIQFGEQLAPFFDVGVKALDNFTKLLSGISPEMKQIIASTLLGNLAFNKVTDTIGILIGTVTKAFLAYQGWRIAMMFMNGSLGEQLNLINGLIKTNAGLLPVLKQVIGLDQSHLLIQTELNTITKTKSQLLKDVLKGEGDRLTNLRELIGLDKQYKLNTLDLNKSLDGKNLILENQIDKVTGVIKATDKLRDAEKVRDSIRESGLQLYDKLNNAVEKELDTKIALTKITKDLKEAELNGDGNIVRKLQQESIALNREYSSSIKEQANIKAEINKKEIEYANSIKTVNDSQVAVDNVRSAAKTRLSVVTAKQLEVETLEANAALYNTKSIKLQTAAEYLRTKAKFDSVNASVFLQRAEFLDAKATEYATKATVTQTAIITGNNEIRKLKIAASLAEQVTDGNLIKVQTLLGASYIKNSLLTKVLFFDITNLAGASTVASTALTGFGATASAAFTFAGTTASAALTMINNKLTALYLKLAPFTLALAPIAAALGLIAAISYDAFFGTTAQVRKLNEELIKVNKQEKDNLIVALDKLKLANMLTKAEQARLERLKIEVDLNKKSAEEYKSVWTSISETISNGTVNVIKFVDSFISGIPILGQYYELYKKITKLPFELISKGFNNFRADQILPVLGEINAATDKTGASINELLKSTKDLQNGFTGFEDIDKLIKDGQILDSNAIDKIKNKAKLIEKETENQITANENRIKAVNEQLKKYDTLNDLERQQASEQEKQLDAHRQVLLANNDKLKEVLSKKKEVDKARIEYQTQQNILLKRVLDNNLEIEKGSTTIEGDKGANALQTRMKKGLRLATEDLEQYRKKVQATLDGTGEYIDETGNKVKIDVTKMTDYVNTFDTNIQGVISSIDQLYQVNGTSAVEAAKVLKDVLDKNKNEMDVVSYIEGINQAVGYMKDGSKQTIDLINIEGETRKAMLNSGVTSTRETNAILRKLNTARLEEEINNQKQLIEFTKNTAGADQKKLDAAKLKLLEQQLAAEQRDNYKAELDERFKQQQSALDKEQTLITLNRKKYLTTEEEFTEQLNTVRKKDLVNKQANLIEQLKLAKNDKEKQLEIEKELLNIQLQYQEIVTSSLEREFIKRNKQLENNVNKTKLIYRELTNVIDNNISSLNEENKIYDSRSKLAASTLQYESSKLTNSLKVTNDIEKRASIETKILELREQTREITDRVERNSLINQQKSIELSLQKQQIELDSRRNDANNNQKLLQLELEKAIKQKNNKEDIEAIKIRLDGNKQEQESITKQNELLQITKRNQEEVNLNANRELQYRQTIAKEGGLLDLEIAKQNEKLAQYEKIAQMANIEASIAETNANKQQLAGELQIKNYQLRLDLLNKQAQLEQQNQDNVQRQFKLAEGLAVNENQKRKLGEQAAKQELLNLDKKQKIERDILDIQIQSNKLAFEKSVLEQKVAEIKLAAELKVQEAETAKVLMSRTATDEEKKGSLATLDAKKFALTAKQLESVFLDKQRQLQGADEFIQRTSLDNKQRTETQDKTIAVAKSTFTTFDDRAIYRALRNNLTGEVNNLNNTRIDFSNDRLTNLFSYPNSNINLEKTNFDSNLGKSKSSNSVNSKDVVINFNPTTNIEVKGNSDVKEFAKQLNSESDKWIKGLHDTLRRVNTELGN